MVFARGFIRTPFHERSEFYVRTKFQSIEFTELIGLIPVLTFKEGQESPFLRIGDAVLILAKLNQG